MKTEKIIAESMPLALKMVRQQLGDNAIIVNTKTIKTGGVFGFFAKQKYEVTAYAEVEPPAPKAPERKATLKQNTVNKPNQKQETNQKKQPKLYGYYAHAQKPQAEETTSKQEKAAAFFEKAAVIFEEIPASAKPEKAAMFFEQPVKQEAPAASQPVKANNDSELLEELQNMKKMMMTFMMNEKQSSALPEGLTKIVNRLKKQGVEEHIIDHIVQTVINKHESLTDVKDEAIKAEVLQLIECIIARNVPADSQIDAKVRVINVVGPTGVGKTTTIAKLATEQVLRQKRRVAMITTDVYRIGAVEQLKTYAGILNVPIEVVRGANELDAAFKKLEHYDLIYMDSTGRNYKEAQHRESINEYLNHPVFSDNYLVLSMTTKFEDMQILLEEFLNSPVKKVILTKFDETGSCGTILNIAYQYPYQFAYITNGQSVPEDITAVDAALVARLLLGEE